MRVVKRVTLLSMSLLVLGFFTEARSQQGKPAAIEAAPEPTYEVRVYNVADLIVPTPDYPYRGLGGPAMGSGSAMTGSKDWGWGIAGSMDSGMGERAMRGAGGSTMGGMAGGSGGAMRNSGGSRRAAGSGLGNASGMMGPSADDAVESESGSLRFSIGALRLVIQQTVEPNSWEEAGGAATCLNLGGLLVVRQTAALHEQLKQLLDDIRREGGVPRPLTVEAHWLFLDTERLAEMAAGLSRPTQTTATDPTARPAPTSKSGKSESIRAGQATLPNTIALSPIDRVVFNRLIETSEGYHGQVSCFDGQTVHIISGRQRTVVTDVTPIVASGAIAYDPEIEQRLAGAILQVRAALAPNGKMVVVDVESSVDHWDEAGLPIQPRGRVTQPEAGGQPPSPVAPVEIDRLNLTVHRLQTTLRIPIGQPVLIGGMTWDPHHSNQSAKRLYFFVEVRAAD